MKVAADAEKLRSQGVDVVDFGAGEPDFPTPDNIKQAAIRALEQNFTKYTAARRNRRAEAGHLRAAQGGLRHRLQARRVHRLGRRQARHFQPHAGADQSRRRSDHSRCRYWVTYKDVVNYAGGKCVFVDTDEEKGFTLTAAMIERRITPKTRMIIINSPSNPSGAVLDRQEFEKIFTSASSAESIC